MPFIAYGSARPSAGLGHICSRLFIEMLSQSVNDVLNGWPHDHGPTKVGVIVKMELSHSAPSAETCDDSSFEALANGATDVVVVRR